MNKAIPIVLPVIFFIVTGCTMQSNQTNSNLDVATSRFKVGQIWKYNNRPNEDSSTLTILKIEKYEKGDTIIHIRVDGIKYIAHNQQQVIQNI